MSGPGTIQRRDALRLVAAAVATIAPSRFARAQKSAPLRIGYWATGIQLALIELIQSRKIFEKYGLAYELVRFADVNGNTLALATDQIDVAFSVSGAGALDLASRKRPIRIVLLTQTADGQLVTKAPEIKTAADLRGKVIGMAPTGSAGAALTKAFLSRNFGLEQGAYRPVGGGEARLLQLLAQGEVAAALLREVSWVQYQKRIGLRSLADQRVEWKRIAGTDAVPPLGLGVVQEKILANRRTDAVAFVAAIMDGIKSGAADHGAVADLMARTLRLDADEAKAYADTWSISFHGRFEDSDVASLELAQRLFVEEKTLTAVADREFFDQTIYRDAVARLT
jgi:NitT/TauT family transport system substrate-binding protein